MECVSKDMDGDTYSASSPSGQHPRGALGVLSSDVANLALPGARKERAHRGLSLDAHTTGQDTTIYHRTTTAYNRTTKLPVSSRHNHMGLGRRSTIACAAIRQPANRRAALLPPAAVHSTAVCHHSAAGYPQKVRRCIESNSECDRDGPNH